MHMERTEIYKIEGMKCSGCSGSVQSALVQEKGVRSASVSHESGVAEISHSLTDDEIVEIVQKAGYQVTGKGR